MSWLVGRLDPTSLEYRFQQLVMSGLQSWEQRLVLNFLNYAHSWLLGVSALVSIHYKRLQAGSIEWILSHIHTPQDSNGKKVQWLNSMSGLYKTWVAANEVRGVFKTERLRRGLSFVVLALAWAQPPPYPQALRDLGWVPRPRA